jgi:hypothetical protein
MQLFFTMNLTGLFWHEVKPKVVERLLISAFGTDVAAI